MMPGRCYCGCIDWVEQSGHKRFELACETVRTFKRLQGGVGESPSMETGLNAAREAVCNSMASVWRKGWSWKA
jgi:hypothetical protein